MNNARTAAIGPYPYLVGPKQNIPRPTETNNTLLSLMTKVPCNLYPKFLYFSPPKRKTETEANNNIQPILNVRPIFFLLK